MYNWTRRSRNECSTTPGRCKALVEVVGKALENLAPARLSWGSGLATFAVNRRNNKEPDVAGPASEGRAEGAGRSRGAGAGGARQPGGMRAIVCGYACHATVLSFYRWSGDYPGFAQLALEKAYPESVALSGPAARRPEPLPRGPSPWPNTTQQLADSVRAVLEAP